MQSVICGNVGVCSIVRSVCILKFNVYQNKIKFGKFVDETFNVFIKINMKRREEVTVKSFKIEYLSCGDIEGR